MLGQTAVIKHHLVALADPASLATDADAEPDTGHDGPGCHRLLHWDLRTFADQLDDVILGAIEDLDRRTLHTYHCQNRADYRCKSRVVVGKAASPDGPSAPPVYA